MEQIIDSYSDEKEEDFIKDFNSISSNADNANYSKDYIGPTLPPNFTISSDNSLILCYKDEKEWNNVSSIDNLSTNNKDCIDSILPPNYTISSNEEVHSDDDNIYNGPLFNGISTETNSIDNQVISKKQKVYQENNSLPEDLLSLSENKSVKEFTTIPLPYQKKPGRYISKKEREESLSSGNPVEIFRNDTVKMSEIIELPPIIKRKTEKRKIPTSDIPNKTIVKLEEHGNGVNCVRWSRPNGHLLLSGSMDQSVKIWDVFRSQKCVLTIRHQGAVKDVQWNYDSSKIISCGYDKLVVLTDVETGKTLQSYKHKDYVTACTYHPNRHNLFLAGGFSSGVACWDTGSNKVVTQYSGMFGSVQALEFINSGKQFVSSSDIMKRNSTDKSMIVWDFETGAVLSNQVYLEAYSCPSVRMHPKGDIFMAQSNGNYIALFSTTSPYKMNKHRRFEGHHVSGYHIKCNFSPDGNILLSGSAEGAIFFWDFYTGRIVKVFRPHRRACMEAIFHPVLSSVMATASWDQSVQVFDKIDEL